VTTEVGRRAVATVALTGVLFATLGTADVKTNDRTSAVAVKAALLYNFAIFTEWPALRPAAPIVICVVGDDQIAASVSRITQGKSIVGHALEIRRSADSTTWTACNLIFIAAAETRQMGNAIGAIKELPILTVSDRAGFSQAGIVELYVEAERMRFAINLDAVERSGLRISSRVLMLARIVRNRDLD